MAADPRFDELEPPQRPEFESFDNVIGAPVGLTDHLRVQLGNASHTDIPRITLVRQDNPTKAYAEIVGPGWPKPLGGPLKNRPDNWGEVHLAVVYPKVPDTEDTFQSPASTECAEYVIIKRINKVALDQYLQMGGRENPRKEVARMRELGDNIHVLRLDDFLEDKEYLYIITQKGVSLLDWFCAEQRNIDPATASQLFTKIIKIIAYFTARNICHHDVSPDNFLLLSNGTMTVNIDISKQLVAFDLALSIRMRANPASRIRHRIFEGEVLYGTICMMSPEVVAFRPYDGVQLDVWGAVCIYVFLLMGFAPFIRPTFTDPLFRVFALARGFDDLNNIEEALALLFENETHNFEVLNRIRLTWNAVLTFTPEQRIMLADSFEVEPNRRLSLQGLLAFIDTESAALPISTAFLTS